MGRFASAIVLLQVGVAFVPFWLFEFGRLGFENAILLGFALVAGYIAILTAEVTTVREAVR